MASVASRQPYPAPPMSANSLASSQSYRVPAPAQAINNVQGLFTSPTESEFSESYKEKPAEIQARSAHQWDETRVSEWLKSINCTQYIDLFRRNNITGENLMDMDQNTLKEIGVKKIGDRVRLGTQVKILRSTIFKQASKRSHNRDSLAILNKDAAMIPPPAASPRALHSSRNNSTIPKPEGRSPRQFSGDVKPNSRPNSPFIDQERARLVRQPQASPNEDIRKGSNASSYSQHSAPSTARYPPSSAQSSIIRPLETPSTARFNNGPRQTPSLDNLNTSNVVGALPPDKPLIRVIYDSGSSAVVNIAGIGKNAEDILRAAIKKGGLNENHLRSYRFYVLDGTIPNNAYCRPITEAELVKLATDGSRNERGRLILRKIHAGLPEGAQLRAAARIGEQQLPSPPAIEVQTKNRLKLDNINDGQLPSRSYPMSPASEEQQRNYFEESTLSRNVSTSTTASTRARTLRDFYGARPPTELITQDLQSYFPEVAKDEMDRTVRMSVYRSQRMSKALNRLSMASTFSVASLIDKDAPPIPSVAESLYGGSGKTLRPLSVARLAHSKLGHRDSITSSVLEPLDEESDVGTAEPDRKSYVSFSNDSGSDITSSNLSVTDPQGNTVMQSYYDDSNASPPMTDVGNSLNSQLSQYIAEDGEEEDPELIQHLQQDSWDDLKYMKGAMIGQGSFGTVFLALHAVTAELMAVKQVELPSTTTTTKDTKKNNMIEALKHEITLLRELTHPNIVRYLGSNSDETHLNIFLEYVTGGSIATMLTNYGSLNEGLIRGFVRQILGGLSYLHSKDIIHRDIKGANILVDNKGTVKISDFGISKRVEASSLLNAQQPKGRGGPRVSLQGSVFWMAPEVVRQTAYTKKADIWSLGCLIVEMFTGSHPHPNCTQLQALFKIGHSGANAEAAKPDLPASATAEAKDFLSKTFEIEHEKRPTADELLASAFCSVKAP